MALEDVFKIQGKEVTQSTRTELEARSAQLANPEKGENKWVTQRQVWFQLTSMAEVVSNKPTTVRDPFTGEGLSTAQALEYANSLPNGTTNYYLGLTANQQNQLQSNLNLSVGPDGVISSTTTSAQKIIKSVPQNFNSIGGLYNEVTLRPNQPTITNIKVTKQGELGSTRKATVDITFFNVQQFEEYEPYLFVPGISIRLEWGWSVGAAFGPQNPLNALYSDDATVTNDIQKKTTANPNYDGFQGRVVNFSYNIEGDLWKGTIEIISAGSGIADKKIDDTSCDCSCKRTSADGEDKEDQPTENIPAQFYALHDQPRQAIKSFKGLFGDAAEVYLVKFAAKDRNAEGEIASDTWIDTESWGETNTEETFISLNTLAAAINLYTGYRDKQNPKRNADGEITFKLNGKPIPIQSHPEIVSTDPYVCILPGQMKKFIASNPDIKGEINNAKSGFRKGFEKFVQFGTVPGQFLNAASGGGLFDIDPQTRVEEYLEGGTPPNFNDDQDDSVGYIGNVLINTRHALKVFKNNKTLSSFMLTLMKDVSDVCGGFWEFDLVDITTEESNSKVPCLVTIMDIKAANKAATAYKIPSKPVGINGNITSMPVVRTLDIKTKLTEGMKSQALYADGAATGATGECPNRFTYIRSNPKTNTAVLNRGVSERILPTNCCVKTDDCDSETEEPKKVFLDAMGKLLLKRTDKRAEAAKVSFLKYLTDLNKKNQESNPKRTFQNCPTIPYPFELSLSLDGIGGFKWGQYITTDRIPERYQTTQTGGTFVWQVTTVEHEITPNDWKTGIQTILRYLDKED